MSSLAPFQAPPTLSIPSTRRGSSGSDSPNWRERRLTTQTSGGGTRALSPTSPHQKWESFNNCLMENLKCAELRVSIGASGITSGSTCIVVQIMRITEAGAEVTATARVTVCDRVYEVGTYISIAKNGESYGEALLFDSGSPRSYKADEMRSYLERLRSHLLQV